MSAIATGFAIFVAASLGGCIGLLIGCSCAAAKVADLQEELGRRKPDCVRPMAPQ